MSLPTMVLFCTSSLVVAQTEQRVFEAAYFNQFAPQTALEMVVRLPGFVLREADEDRGLSQGGTNVLINEQPIIGKGEAATQQISQIAAASVERIEVLDAGALDLPGFNGLVANVITRQTSVSGAFEWQPQWRRNNEPTLLNGTANLSGSRGALDFSAALNSTQVRASFIGPETLEDVDGDVFERRQERLFIIGNQPTLSGSVNWTLPDDRVLNAKAAVTQLDLERPQDSVSAAVTSRGFDGSNLAVFRQQRRNYRLDADYRFPAFGGALKVITFASRTDNQAATRLTIDSTAEGPIANRRFREDSVQQERIVRFEQNWDRAHSWQLALEGATNALDLDTVFEVFDPLLLTTVISTSAASTRITESRAELTVAHRRALTDHLDLQVSIGGETSTLEQGAVRRRFDRPKGFVSLNFTPDDDWTISARATRDVGQINFRDFAANVSLIEEITTENNPALKPDQSWLMTLRGERRFSAGHVASLSVSHERIRDLVDRIPLGESGDAIGNIDDARRDEVNAVVTLVGAPFGLPGARFDLRGRWQRSALTDPIEGFERDIGHLITQDLQAEFRHDVAGTPWSYGFTAQQLEIAPRYQSTLVQFRNVPGGGLTPGQNTVFVEHKDWFGLRVRATLSEFVGQYSKLTRTIYDGRRDVAQIDRVERRRRDLDGPYVSLSVGKTF